MSKTVLVFGVFDGFHPGHEALLRQAVRYGQVVAVVARDDAVKALKGFTPRHSQQERLDAINESEHVSEAILGDQEQGLYSPINRYHPDVICLGYDQDTLAQDLEKWLEKNNKKVELIQLEPYHPDKYKSSKL